MTQLPNSPAPATRGPTVYQWIIVVLGSIVALFAIYRFTNAQPPPQLGDATHELRKIAVVPPFALTERSGKQITNRNLAGKVWVADFIYTTCPGPCPLVTAGMAKVQDAVQHDPRVQLVTFTVDPDTDTPPVLAKYADTFHADHDRWWFITGPKKPLYDLIQNGFLQVVQDNSNQPPQDGQFKVTHSTYLALVDGDGNVRGFYAGTDNAGRADLLRDIAELEKESP
jgi:protein SCO1/2